MQTAPVSCLSLFDTNKVFSCFISFKANSRCQRLGGQMLALWSRTQKLNVLLYYSL